MSRQSTADNLADLVRIFGGSVRGGETKAQLVDMLEDLAPQATIDPDALSSAFETYLEEHTGGLTDEDMAEIFGE